MNDFTKEELEILYKALDYCLWKVPLGVDTRPVRSKVIDMIDNYCDHKNDKAVSDVDYGMVCADCDATLGFI